MKVFSQKSKQSFFDDSHLNDEGIALFVDALRLSQTALLPENILDHVLECASCKVAIIELDSMLNEIPVVQFKEHPFFRSIQKSAVRENALLYRIAAAITTMIGIGLIAYYLSLFWKEKHSVLQSSSEIHANIKDPVASNGYLDTKEFEGRNFAENPFLEDMIKSEYRSPDFEVASPKNGIKIKSPIHFLWRGEQRGVINLKIINNIGKVEYTLQTANSSIILTKKLRPGLYYWKIESKNELLRMGKFIAE